MADTATQNNNGSLLSELRMLQLASPSLPTGGFAYSQGLEWAVEAGWINDVPLQILPQRLRYQEDQVLDEMVRALGLQVEAKELPFEPEPGAYHGGHRHSE